MPRTAIKSKAASKTDKYYQETKDKMDSVLREYNEKTGGRISWYFEADKRSRRITATVYIHERDRYTANKIAGDVVGRLKNRGINIDALSIEPAGGVWRLEAKVKVKIPTVRKY